MNKFKIQILVASLLGLIAGVLYNREPMGHGKYAAVPPRIAVGIFIGCIWYFAFFFSGKSKSLNSPWSRRMLVALIILSALVISIFSIYYPMESLYWY